MVIFIQQNQQFNANFDPDEYVKFINETKGNMTEEGYEDFFINNVHNLFLLWRRNVWNLVYSHVQLALEDLPDFSYRITFYEGGITPQDMANHIIQNIP